MVPPLIDTSKFLLRAAVLSISAKRYHQKIAYTPQVTSVKSNATKILVPINKCENLVAGVPNLTTTALIDDTLNKLQETISKKCL